jgi:GT2 family glycosyltransferase
MIEATTRTSYAPLIISGMHRSGTSLTSALLNRAGLHLGERVNPPALDNPLGYYENLDFVRLHESIFRSYGYPEEGWFLKPIMPSAFFDLGQEALRINATAQMWGFKDPRATMMLDFWSEISPAACFLFVVRPPWQVADSLFRRGDLIFKGNPGFALEVWNAYNSAILDFFRRQPSRCLIVSLDYVVEHPLSLVAALNEKFAMELSAPSQPVYQESLLHRNAPSAELSEEIAGGCFPLSLKLWEELQEVCLSDGSAAFNEVLDGLSKKLKEREVALQSLQSEIQRFQIDQVQIKLELSQARASYENARCELNRRQKEADELHLQLHSVSSHLDKTSKDLCTSRLQTQLARCQLGELQIKMQQGTTVLTVVKDSLRRLKAPLRRLRHSVRKIDRVRSLSAAWINQNSSANFQAIDAIVKERNLATSTDISVDPLCPLPANELPKIDINVVTYNSSRWIDSFIESLINSDYPKSLLAVTFIDNNSTDSTVCDLMRQIPRLETCGFTVVLKKLKTNLGFGTAHNAAMAGGTGQFCLITNIDLTFEPETLSRIGRIAQADDQRVAAWELRQKPYEHPKFYDPVTGITNWNSHACVLLRREAFELLGGYDENLFLYGEDVELSYRLRRSGFILRYCPNAVVWHYSYEQEEQIKPLQYKGSTFANMYLRLKYGNARDIISIPLMFLEVLSVPEAYPGSRRAIWENFFNLFVKAPSALLGRSESIAYFPFRSWDYEMTREGAFVSQVSISSCAPLVSVITRTRPGREHLLRQAVLSIAHQTYPNVEHIVVEDGGATTRELIDDMSQTTGRSIRFLGQPKRGRAAAGNAGLAAATGQWCLFLDDDDILFSDHVELLAAKLMETPKAVAAYSIAWEAITDYPLEDGRYTENCHSVSSLHRQAFDYEVLKHHNFMPVQSVLFERKLFEERGGMDERLDALEDWNLWLRFAYRNHFVFVPKVTSMFRTPADAEKSLQRTQMLNSYYELARRNADQANRELDATANSYAKVMELSRYCCSI